QTCLSTKKINGNRLVSRLFTMTKRSRVEQDVSVLAADVFDTLMQATRKELAQLLSLFIKRSAPDVLNDVLAEAKKCGAVVATSSKWQKCTHHMLDLCFSFLEEKDLEKAEIICRRWR